MFRSLVFIHRWLGIIVGIVLLLWCLSGFVMMYVQYPELNDQQHHQILANISLDDCCQLPETDYMEGDTVDYFAIEMLSGSPILRLGWFSNDEIGIDIKKGEWLNEITKNHAQQIAAIFKNQQQINGDLEYRGAIYNDQWTVYSKYNSHRPLHYFAANDDAGTEWYISSTSGEIMQITTGSQRFWNWFGSVTHWIYFTRIRENTVIWSQIVIWLTIIGIFLTVIGIYLGIKQFKFKTDIPVRSPYKAWGLWHHYIGLIFGLFTLTWVVSGLFSMNPWGALEGSGYQTEAVQISGQPIPWSGIKSFLNRLADRSLPDDLVRLEVTTLLGELNLVGHYSNRESERLDIDTFSHETISQQLLDRISEKLRPDVGIMQASMIDNDDTYYYSHHELKTFPAYRVIIDDAEQTRYYLNTLNGTIMEKIDSNRKWYRWLFQSLHRGDFSVFFRSRPVWDFFMLFLLTGVTIVSATGCYMGMKRIRIIK